MMSNMQSISRAIVGFIGIFIIYMTYNWQVKMFSRRHIDTILQKKTKRFLFEGIILDLEGNFVKGETEKKID